MLGNIQRVLLVLGEGEHVYHENPILVLFFVSVLFFLPPCPSELLSSFFLRRWDQSVCLGLKRWDYNTGVLAVRWSAGMAMLGLFVAFAAGRVGPALGRVLSRFVSPLTFVSRQRRYVHVLYNRNRKGKGWYLCLRLLALSYFGDFLCFSVWDTVVCE